MLQCYNVTFPASQWSEILVKRVSMLPVALNYANGSKAAPSPCGKILPEPANRPTLCGVASCFCNLSPRAISSRYFLALFPRAISSLPAHKHLPSPTIDPPSPTIDPPLPTNILPRPQSSLPRPAIPSVRRRFPLSFPYHPLTNPLAFSVLLRESSGYVKGMIRQWPFKARRRPFGPRA